MHAICISSIALLCIRSALATTQIVQRTLYNYSCSSCIPSSVRVTDRSLNNVWMSLSIFHTSTIRSLSSKRDTHISRAVSSSSSQRVRHACHLPVIGYPVIHTLSVSINTTRTHVKGCNVIWLVDA